MLLLITIYTGWLPIWLVVSIPLKNIGQLFTLFPIYGKIKAMFQTTNQLFFGLNIAVDNRLPILDTLQKKSLLVNVDIPIDTKRLKD